MSINIVHLVGRAGRDPEVKDLASGKQLCKFTLAVNRPTSKTDEPPDWFDLEIWGKTVDVARNYVKKGSLIGVQGSLKIDSWKDGNSGERRTRPVIKVDRLELLGSKSSNNTGYSNMEDKEM